EIDSHDLLSHLGIQIASRISHPGPPASAAPAPRLHPAAAPPAARSPGSPAAAGSPRYGPRARSQPPAARWRGDRCTSPPASGAGSSSPATAAAPPQSPLPLLRHLASIEDLFQIPVVVAEFRERAVRATTQQGLHDLVAPIHQRRLRIPLLQEAADRLLGPWGSCGQSGEVDIILTNVVAQNRLSETSERRSELNHPLLSRILRQVAHLPLVADEHRLRIDLGHAPSFSRSGVISSVSGIPAAA